MIQQLLDFGSTDIWYIMFNNKLWFKYEIKCIACKSYSRPTFEKMSTF